MMSPVEDQPQSPESEADGSATEATSAVNENVEFPVDESPAASPALLATVGNESETCRQRVKKSWQQHRAQVILFSALSAVSLAASIFFVTETIKASHFFNVVLFAIFSIICLGSIIRISYLLSPCCKKIYSHFNVSSPPTQPPSTESETGPSTPAKDLELQTLPSIDSSFQSGQTTPRDVDALNLEKMASTSTSGVSSPTERPMVSQIHRDAASPQVTDMHGLPSITVTTHSLNLTDNSGDSIVAVESGSSETMPSSTGGESPTEPPVVSPIPKDSASPEVTSVHGLPSITVTTHSPNLTDNSEDSIVAAETSSSETTSQESGAVDASTLKRTVAKPEAVSESDTPKSESTTKSCSDAPCSMVSNDKES